MARIFVSHAAADKELVQEFADLLHLGVGVTPDDIFCSSLPGVGIPTGSDFVQHIKSQVQNPELVLLVISEAFRKSHFCWSEVGASWALSIPVYPLLAPPLGYAAVDGVLIGKQASKLDDKLKLNDLRDDLIETLSLRRYSTSHWERTRDKFLQQLTALTAKEMRATTDTTAATSASSGGVILSSDNLLKLSRRYFKADSVFRPDRNTIVIELATSEPEEEAALEHLRPQDRRGEIVSFAYQNDGGFVQIDSVTSTSVGGKHHWTVKATRAAGHHDSAFSEMNVQGHSADEIAAMRAGRALINVPPPPKKKRDHGVGYDIVEHAICGGSGTEITIDRCIVKQVLEEHRANPELGSKLARLEAVFVLKATGVIENILEFSLTPMADGQVLVKFRGQRPHHYSNVEPEIITIEGECKLA